MVTSFRSYHWYCVGRMRTGNDHSQKKKEKHKTWTFVIHTSYQGICREKISQASNIKFINKQIRDHKKYIIGYDRVLHAHFSFKLLMNLSLENQNFGQFTMNVDVHNYINIRNRPNHRHGDLFTKLNMLRTSLLRNVLVQTARLCHYNMTCKQ